VSGVSLPSAVSLAKQRSTQRLGIVPKTGTSSVRKTRKSPLNTETNLNSTFMPPKSLVDLEIYRLAKELNRASYPVLAKISSFAYRNQMMRSSLSIPSNIAEGYGRHSKASFLLYLRYSMGSLYEFQLQLELAADNGVMEKEDATRLIENCDELIAKMTNYMKWLKKL